MDRGGRRRPSGTPKLRRAHATGRGIVSPTPPPHLPPQASEHPRRRRSRALTAVRRARAQRRARSSRQLPTPGRRTSRGDRRRRGGGGVLSGATRAVSRVRPAPRRTERSRRATWRRRRPAARCGGRGLGKGDRDRGAAAAAGLAAARFPGSAPALAGLVARNAGGRPARA